MHQSATPDEQDPKQGDRKDDPVGPDRPSGVPPETNDDQDDEVDHDSADSFPASDPPGHY